MIPYSIKQKLEQALLCYFLFSLLFLTYSKPTRAAAMAFTSCPALPNIMDTRGEDFEWSSDGVNLPLEQGDSLASQGIVITKDAVFLPGNNYIYQLGYQGDSLVKMPSIRTGLPWEFPAQPPYLPWENNKGKNIPVRKFLQRVHLFSGMETETNTPGDSATLFAGNGLSLSRIPLQASSYSDTFAINQKPYDSLSILYADQNASLDKHRNVLWYIDKHNLHQITKDGHKEIKLKVSSVQDSNELITENEDFELFPSQKTTYSESVLVGAGEHLVIVTHENIKIPLTKPQYDLVINNNYFWKVEVSYENPETNSSPTFLDSGLTISFFNTKTKKVEWSRALPSNLGIKSKIALTDEFVYVYENDVVVILSIHNGEPYYTEACPYHDRDQEVERKGLVVNQKGDFFVQSTNSLLAFFHDRENKTFHKKIFNIAYKPSTFRPAKGLLLTKEEKLIATWWNDANGFSNEILIVAFDTDHDELCAEKVYRKRNPVKKPWLIASPNIDDHGHLFLPVLSVGLEGATYLMTKIDYHGLSETAPWPKTARDQANSNWRPYTPNQRSDQDPVTSAPTPAEPELIPGLRQLGCEYYFKKENQAFFENSIKAKPEPVSQYFSPIMAPLPEPPVRRTAPEIDPDFLYLHLLMAR